VCTIYNNKKKRSYDFPLQRCVVIVRDTTAVELRDIDKLNMSEPRPHSKSSPLSPLDVAVADVSHLTILYRGFG